MELIPLGLGQGMPTGPCCGLSGGGDGERGRQQSVHGVLKSVLVSYCGNNFLKLGMCPLELKARIVFPLEPEGGAHPRPV